MSVNKTVIDFELGEKIFHGKDRHEIFVRGFYDKDLKDYIDKINSALSEKNWIVLSREAHSLQVKCEYLGSLEISKAAQSLHLACREKSPSYIGIMTIASQLLTQAENLQKFLDERYGLVKEKSLSHYKNSLHTSLSSSERKDPNPIKIIPEILIKRQFSDQPSIPMQIDEYEVTKKRIPPPICKATAFISEEWKEEEENDSYEEINKTWKCILL